MPDPTGQSISATEMPALLHASPYSTRWMLYRKFAHGEDLSTPEDARMNWGKRLEPLVLEAAAEELHLEVVPNRGADGRQVYERRGMIGATRDATIICPDRGPGTLETKCIFDYGVWMRDWNGGKTPPRHHEIQTQVQMFVGDGAEPFKWGTLTAWLAGELHHFPREPIPKLWALFEEEAARFFADVAARREPEPFGAPVEVPLLTEVYATQPGAVLVMDELTKENLAIAEKVRLLNWHSSERLGHEKAEKDIKAALLALAKEHDTIQLPYGIKATIKQQSRAGFTVKPTTFKVVGTYIPKDVPEGNIGDAW